MRIKGRVGRVKHYTSSWKKVLLSAIVGACIWTVALSPYVIFIVGMNYTQYLSWLVMEFILVPPIAPIVFYVTEKVTVRFKYKL